MHADLISILGDKPQVALFALFAANLENLQGAIDLLFETQMDISGEQKLKHYHFSMGHRNKDQKREECNIENSIDEEEKSMKLCILCNRKESCHP